MQEISVYPKASLCIEYTDIWKEIRHKSQEEIKSKIKEYLETPIPIQSFLQTSHLPSQSSKPAQVIQTLKTIEEIIIADANPPPNAAAQKKAVETINITNTKLAEFQRIYNSTTDLEIWNDLEVHIVNIEANFT